MTLPGAVTILAFVNAWTSGVFCLIPTAGATCECNGAHIPNINPNRSPKIGPNVRLSGRDIEIRRRENEVNVDMVSSPEVNAEFWLNFCPDGSRNGVATIA
jgi:hypothetical protein